MLKWVVKGLKTGIVSSRYPDTEDVSHGITPGMPERIIENIKDFNCPVDAVSASGVIDRRKCLHCMLCKDKSIWKDDFTWTILKNQSAVFPKSFFRSVHIRVVDAGGCGACLNEIKLLNNPYYNMHRLGFFITPTPRKADLLLVFGPVSEQMREPLLKSYEAMPEPKRVMAVGSCALSGGVFGPNFTTLKGVSEVIPVDIEIPGCPPPPLAILHGLLVIAGRNKNILSEKEER